MSYFFDDPEARLALASALTAWEHTPFQQGLSIQGSGVDCIGFVREIYRACGVDVSPVEHIPEYSLFWGVHHEYSPLVGWLHSDPDARSRFVRPDAEDPILPGDLWTIRNSMAAHHMAIAGAEDHPRIWHVPVGGSVTSMDPESLLKTAKVVMRLRLKST